jgi:N,N'-diacetyllegionaminate synthase
MSNKVYNILEIANVHDGNFDYLMSLLDDYEIYKKGFGIKFQPFKYDRIALPDFSWYEVYKKLYFTPEQWEQAITKASRSKEVWIDCFDDYTYEIVSANFKLIRGLKFQASVLYNKSLLKKFSSLDFSTKSIILNVSGYALPAIQQVMDEFRKMLNPGEIILQIGFQSYPTEMQDSGLSKIAVLKQKFGCRLSFADHVDPALEDAYVLPMTSVLLGCEVIEKHIRRSGKLPQYDFASSLDAEQYKRFIEMQSGYVTALNQPYINAKEENYLKTSIQIPVLNKDVQAGSLLSLSEDFSFKRSNQTGLRTNDVSEYINNFYVLSAPKKINETLQAEDFKKANIATIIACRLKSSRLPKKAVLNIGSLPSVEMCIKNALSFKNVNMTVLATSDLEEDAALAAHTYNPSVVFHIGHPLDVMKRFLDVVDKYKIDVFIRITADMPFVDDQMLQILLKSHFETGADYTRARKAAIGTGMEIINGAALRKAKSFFPAADYSEYMTYYFTNNSRYFKINEVDLPAELVRDYRLTLDYPEDLTMFNKIMDHLKEKNLPISLKNIFEFLDQNPEVAKINAGMEVRYHTDKTLVDTLNKFTTIPA